jgi:predicted RNase H-like HicB family nuclease
MMSVRVIYEPADDAWMVSSPDVPGWTSGGETLEEARRMAEEGVPFALDLEPGEVELRHFVPATFEA